MKKFWHYFKVWLGLSVAHLIAAVVLLVIGKALLLTFWGVALYLTIQKKGEYTIKNVRDEILK